MKLKDYFVNLSREDFMPIARKYKAGSIIYFQGDKGEDVYILKSGAVTLTYVSLETGEEVKENIKTGEFFGVKSALGRYPREETAQVAVDSLVLVLNAKEFEALCIKNPSLVVKMLKVFSNQLRRVGMQQKHLLTAGREIVEDSEVMLFKIGDYYLKNKKLGQAKYIFNRYMEYYPSGKLVEKAKERLKLVAQGEETGFVNVSLIDEVAKPAEQKAKAATQYAKMEEGKLKIQSIDHAKKYYEAVSLFSQGNVDDALSIYLSLAKDIKEKEDDILEKVKYEIGRVYFAKKDYENATKSFAGFIKEYPKSVYVKDALFNIAKSYEILGDKANAINFYKKVAGMPPKEMINRRAQSAIEKLGGK